MPNHLAVPRGSRAGFRPETQDLLQTPVSQPIFAGTMRPHSSTPRGPKSRSIHHADTCVLRSPADNRGHFGRRRRWRSVGRCALQSGGGHATAGGISEPAGVVLMAAKRRFRATTVPKRARTQRAHTRARNRAKPCPASEERDVPQRWRKGQWLTHGPRLRLRWQPRDRNLGKRTQRPACRALPDRGKEGSETPTTSSCRALDKRGR